MEHFYESPGRNGKKNFRKVKKITSIESNKGYS
jgi:hypothetical protein